MLDKRKGHEGGGTFAPKEETVDNGIFGAVQRIVNCQSPKWPKSSRSPAKRPKKQPTYSVKSRFLYHRPST